MDEALQMVQNCPEFQCRFEPSAFSEEAYDLYKRYQVAVHGDHPAEVSKKSYTSFLCQSPLEQKSLGCTIFGWDLKLGTFHVHYLIRGHLMAVSVIDVLPHCISSVYLF
jgi:arginine-tRNA-protein transferase